MGSGMIALHSRRWIASTCVVLFAPLGACGNVTVMNEHTEVARPNATYEASSATCETVKTLATIDAVASTAMAVASLGSRRHRFEAANHALRAASDVPAASMVCTPP